MISQLCKSALLGGGDDGRVVLRLEDLGEVVGHGILVLGDRVKLLRQLAGRWHVALIRHYAPPTDVQHIQQLQSSIIIADECPKNIDTPNEN